MTQHTDAITDASATLSMTRRKGLGKSRHVHTNYLWVQGINDMREVDYSKVAGTEKRSDIITKHLPYDKLAYMFPKMGLEHVDGQDEAAYSADQLCHGGKAAQISSVDVTRMLAKVEEEVKMRYHNEGQLRAWHRIDEDARNSTTSMKGGPEWRKAKLRITCALRRTEKPIIEEVKGMARRDEHRQMPWPHEGHLHISPLLNCAVEFFVGLGH